MAGRDNGMKKTFWLPLLIACFLIVLSSLFAGNTTTDFYFSPDVTLKQFARQNNVKLGKVKSELGISTDRGRNTLLELTLDSEKAFAVISHIRGDFSTKKMAVCQMAFAIVVIFAIFLLSQKRMSSAVKYSLLIIVIMVFGFMLGKAYNPMVGLVKVFKGVVGIEGNLTARLMVLVLFCLMAVVGTKAVCGWACPFGALQEIFFKLPLLRSFKEKNKLPFWISNSIRISLFAFFLITLVFNLFGLTEQGRVLYHFINPFNLFEFNFSLNSVGIYLILVLIASFLFYRPHCHFACPFGLLAWLLERISIFRIHINMEKCTGCGECIKVCPCLAMKGLYEQTAFPADCFSCGECLNACKFDALEYASKTKWSL